MTTSLKTNFLISDLQQVSSLKTDAAADKLASEPSNVSCNSSSCCSLPRSEDKQCPKPIVLVTNGEWIDSPGLTFLVQALVDSHLDVYVCAPKSGAACCLNTQRKNVEIESVGVASNMSSQETVKYFRLEFLEEQQDNADEDPDIRALKDGFLS